MGLLDRIGFGRLKEGLAKTRQGLLDKVGRLVAGRNRIDDALLDELEEILVSADVGPGTAGAIIERLRQRVKEEGVGAASELRVLLKDEIERQMGEGASVNGTDAFHRLPAVPFVIMVVGVNGAGKTTTIGKLARGYRNAGKSVLIAAADTFRAAANEQLEVWAKRAGAEIIQQAQGSDPAAVAFDALKSAVARGGDVVIVDTAGRLHTKMNLMEELKKIRRVIRKVVPEAPHEVLLVIDASTGQNGLQQAKLFGEAAGVTGIVLTKLDGTAKGGIVLSIRRETNLPVKFVGVGEAIDDLQEFDPKAFVEALFAQ